MIWRELSRRFIMAVIYDKLWKLLQEKNMKRIEMQRKTGISGNILVRMGRNEYISIESIEKICCALHCSKDDILEFVNGDSVESEDQ